MIQLAINYSSQAAELVSSGRIQLDRFKTPDWPEMIAEAMQLRPAAVHFNLYAGRGRLTQVNWEPIERLLELTGTPYVNLHLEARLQDFPYMHRNTTDPDQRQQILSQMVADLQIAVQRFGPERVIAENVPFRLAGKILRPCVEPELISLALAETGCGLLLDLSHARISARSMGIEEDEYIDRLPMQRLCEMHFTGIHDLDGWLQDHLAALPADWQALDRALEHIRAGEWPAPWLLAFEYGGIGEKFAPRSNPQVIAAQMPLLYERLRRL